MLQAIRARKSELQITNETLDAISGMPAGYASKLLCDPPLKRMGALSLGLVLASLGYTIDLVPDANALALVRSRMEVRKRAPKAIAPRRQPAWLFTHESARKIGALGVRKQAELRAARAMLAEKKRKAALARWKKVRESVGLSPSEQVPVV